MRLLLRNMLVPLCPQTVVLLFSIRCISKSEIMLRRAILGEGQSSDAAEREAGRT